MYGKHVRLRGRDKIKSPKTPNISFLHHTLDVSPPRIIYQSCRNCSNFPRDTLCSPSRIKESKIWPQNPTRLVLTKSTLHTVKKIESNLAPDPCIRPRRKNKKKKRERNPSNALGDSLPSIFIVTDTELNRTEQNRYADAAGRRTPGNSSQGGTNGCSCEFVYICTDHVECMEQFLGTISRYQPAGNRNGKRIKTKFGDIQQLH